MIKKVIFTWNRCNSW